MEIKNEIEVSQFKETMSSREIAEITGKEHSHVMRDIRLLIVQGVDESNFGLVDYCDSKGEKRPMYQLTKKGCLILASGYNAMLREKIINRWEQLEIEHRNKFPIPQTYSEALMLAANQAKQIEAQQLEIKSQMAKNKLLEACNIDNVKQLNEQKPKVEFFDQVTDSKDAVDMASCAKTLNMGIGRNRLFEFLRTRSILDRHNLPYQRYIDLGYFRTIEQKFSKPDGTNCINIKTVVYQKGMDYIRKLLKSGLK